MEKENKKGKGWLVILFIIIIVGLLGYILYDKGVFKNVFKGNVCETCKTCETNSSVSTDEITEIGQVLFAKTKVNYGQMDYFFYDKNNASYNLMSNNTKLDLAFQFLTGKDLKMNLAFNPTSCYDNNGVSKCVYESTSKSDFENSYHNLFGNDKTITYTEFQLSDAIETCKLENDTINCYPYSGGDTTNEKEFIQYNGAYQGDDNTIIVKTNLLVAAISDGVYADPELSKKIDNSTYIDTYNLNDLTEDIMFKKYSSSVGTYEVTFKKDTNGNYYWVSTSKTN